MKKYVGPVRSMVPALTRGLRVLEVLSRDPYEMTHAELSEKLGVPSASLWRILKVLEDGDFLIFDEKRHSYRIGFKLMHMGNNVLGGAHFRSHARDFLIKLAEATGETAELDVRIRDQLVVADQVTGPNAVYLYSHPGSAMPYFHATAPGKIYLADMDSEKVRHVMGKLGFPRLTRHTIQGLSQLEKELEKVNIDGYAVDIEEMREGVGRVAAPVFDASKKLVACLAIACPAFRLVEPNRKYEYGQRVKEIASMMSQSQGRI